MSCNCNGSTTAVNAGSLYANNQLNNGFAQVADPFYLNQGFSQAVNNGSLYANNQLNAGSLYASSPLYNNQGFSQAVNSVNNQLNASNTCNSLLGATYSATSPLEQSYTFNPQVTSPLPGTRPVNLSVGTSNYIPSVTVPLLSAQTGFVNYHVRPTATYLNTCN